LDDIRVIFGLTYDKVRRLTKDPDAKIDIDHQKHLTVARYKHGTYQPGPSDRYDWATFEIEVITPNQGPLKPAKALVKNWISERADDGGKHDLAMLGHPLGLPLTLVENKSSLRWVYPPGAHERSQALPKRPQGMVLAAMDSVEGYSGAPVLTKGLDGKWQIVGLCVGTAWHGKAANPIARDCALTRGNVVNRTSGSNSILPAEFFL
jgi:hypothetical protein